MDVIRTRVLAPLAAAALLLSCQTTHDLKDAEGSAGAARQVVASHERFIRAGDLTGIMSNVADDVVVLAPNVSLAEGKAAVERLYGSFLSSGRFDLVHEYRGAQVAGDVVIFHGVARGTFTPASGQPVSFANNFFLALKRQPGGRYMLWRSAFAPAGGPS